MVSLLQSLKSFFGGAPAAGKSGGAQAGKTRGSSLHDEFEDTYAAVAFAERGEHVMAERDILGALQRDTRRTKHTLGSLLQDVGLNASRAWYGHVVV